MKKLFSLLLVGIMVISFASCKKNAPANGEVSDESVISEEISEIISEDSLEESIEESKEEISKEESKAESKEESKEITPSKPSEPPVPKPEESKAPVEPSKPAVNVTAQSVYDAMDKAVADRHTGVTNAIMNMPMQVDDMILSDMFGINVSDVKGYKGVCAGSMTNCDIMIVVEANDGKKDTVKKALEDKLTAQKAQFEHYGVMGNIERLEAAKIVDKGNFVALLIVGIMGEGEETYDCAGDVSAAVSAFNKCF